MARTPESKKQTVSHIAKKNFATPLNIVDPLTRTGREGTSGSPGANGVPGNNPSGTNRGNGTDGGNATPSVANSTFTGDAGGDLINFSRNATGGSGGYAGYGGNSGGPQVYSNFVQGPDFSETFIEYGLAGNAGLGGASGLAGQAVVRYAELTFNLGLATGAQNTVRLIGNATGGQGGAGGAGGDGGFGGSTVIEVSTSPGPSPFTTGYYQTGGQGENGANGLAGAGGGLARTIFSNLNVTGDVVSMIISGTASGHGGGQGGNGGRGGTGDPGGMGGSGGSGGSGAEGLATVDKLFMTVTGGLNLQLSLDGTGGQGANGGTGGVGGLGSYSYYTNQAGLQSQTIDNAFATSGNGGHGGNGGEGNAALRNSAIVGSAAVDVVAITLAAHGGLAGSGGRGGSGEATTTTVNGYVTTHTVGTPQGTRGPDGTAGAATAEMRNVSIKLGNGDDRLTISLLANGPGTKTVIFSDNSFDGGCGSNDRLTLGIGQTGEQFAVVNVELGTLKMGSGTGGTIAGFEDFRGTTGNDRFTDGTGDQRYSGGLGGDSFVFNAGLAGTDRIQDFETADVIRLRGFGVSLDSYAEVMLNTTDTTSGAMIKTSGTSFILLDSITKASLQANDFTF